MALNIELRVTNSLKTTVHTEISIKAGDADLKKFVMYLSPECAADMSNRLAKELAPIMAWRAQPLYQWAKRKTSGS